MLEDARALADSVLQKNPDPAPVHEILESTHMAIEHCLCATAENPPSKPKRSKKKLSRTRTLSMVTRRKAQGATDTEECETALLGNGNNGPYNDLCSEHPALQLPVLNAKTNPKYVL